MNRTGLKIVIVLLTISFLVGGNAFASEVKRVYLDDTTIAKGYTVESDDTRFKLGIFPDVFSNAGAVKIDKLKSENLNLPENHYLISDYYLYNVENADSILNGSVAVGFTYESDEAYHKSVYFLNEIDDTWREVPSTFNRDNKYGGAFLPFPYAKVAILEDRSRLLEPVRSTESPVPGIWADAGIVLDVESGKVLYEKNKDQQMTLASLTKIMTAMVFLESGTSLDKEVMMTEGDVAECCCLQVDAGETLLARDLFYAALVGSMNNGARALARSTDLNWDEFIQRMNNKAGDLGFTQTIFSDPTGLDWRNKSSAHEYARLSVEAYKDIRMLQASTARSYGFHTRNTGRWVSFNNINKSLDSSLYITGGKTGYLPESWGGVGFNLMLKARNGGNHEVIVVVLGEDQSGLSFSEAEMLVNWAFSNYRWN